MVKRKKKIGIKEDMTMKKNILSMAVLLMASAAVFTACSSDDNITGEQPANSVQKTYTMTVNATKGDDATTRALTLGRNDADTKNVLNATWDANEVVLVYQNGSQIGTLYSAASTTSATTLTGELDSAPDAGQDLTLYFHTNATPSYAGQDGTLATIASTYDFCEPATITAGSFTVSGSTVSTTGSANFGANQQAIVKFTLIDKADGLTPLSATKLVISVGATDYTITPTSPTNEIYAAIPGFEGQTVTLTATVDEDTYIYKKASQSFTNGQYYEITVKMTKQEPTTLDNTITAWTAGSYAVPAGGLTYSDAITVSGDVTLTLTDGETLTLNKGISLAEGATLTVKGNGTMNVNGTNENTSSTVAGTGKLVLTSGTLNAEGGDGRSLSEWESISEITGESGGTAINGSVTVSGGTLTATGGNGGDLNLNEIGDNCKGGLGGTAITGSVIITSGTLTATGGNGGSLSCGKTVSDCHAGNGGDAIGGSVIITSGTLTATGGNGGSLICGVACDDCHAGNGGDAIGGSVTENGGTTTFADGSNGSASIGEACNKCSEGSGGKSNN